jgi:hypothetical protein
MHDEWSNIMPTGQKYLVHDLKTLERGTTVVVHLSGSAANVRLMDSSNYQSYKSGRAHRYFGGLVKRSPHRIVVPKRAHWYLTVDMAGLRGTARAQVDIEPPPLPTARSATDHGSLASLRRELPTGVDPSVDETWDVFICHAGEDKREVAIPLYEALTALGVKAWIDIQLRIGDSLRRKIDHGLARSKFGIVVFSPSFFAKEWPQYELDGIVTRTLAGKQTILPIWHNISEEQMIDHVPPLADRVARDTAVHSIDAIAAEIADVVLPHEGVA